MKAKTKKLLNRVAAVGLFLVRNWKKITPVVGIVSATTAAYMGKLQPFIDAAEPLVL